MKKAVFFLLILLAGIALWAQLNPEMVWINGGRFTMGSPPEDAEGHAWEEKPHRVTVSSFFMGKYEVTQKEYQEIMGNNPSHFKGVKLPVERVSWYDAIEFCNRLSLLKLLIPAYTINGENVTWNRRANGYRLPTEAEWEYACRAGTDTPYNTGRNITTDQANYDGTYQYITRGIYRQRTTTVGTFEPNLWGLYDMHGNVWEWCWDWYEWEYPAEEQFDPAGPHSGSTRIVRGGSWPYAVITARSGKRGYYAPSARDYATGFRIVRSSFD
jgi:formylglycine-generating enzyme required for sulfatase activity